MAEADASAPVVMAPALLTRLEVEDFLFQEAELLDGWQLEAWLKMMAPGITYAIPTPDAPRGDPMRDLFLVHDDTFLLRERVQQLLGKTAHSEVPRSQTRRLVGNVRVSRRSDGDLDVKANFIIHRNQRDVVDVYQGEYTHHLIETGSGYMFKYRKAILSFTTLRQQGKISIII